MLPDCSRVAAKHNADAYRCRLFDGHLMLMLHFYHCRTMHIPLQPHYHGHPSFRYFFEFYGISFIVFVSFRNATAKKIIVPVYCGFKSNTPQTLIYPNRNQNTFSLCYLFKQYYFLYFARVAELFDVYPSPFMCVASNFVCSNIRLFQKHLQ